MLPSELEKLTPEQKFNEYVMTSLRTAEGLSLDLVKEQFGEHAVTHIQAAVAKHVVAGLVKQTGCLFQLTRQGKLYADGIAAHLFK